MQTAPEPGKKLAQTAVFLGEIDTKITEFLNAFTDPATDGEFAKFILDLQQRIGKNADAYQRILQHASSRAEQESVKSDHHSLLAMLYGALGHALEESLIVWLTSKNQPSLEGDTWSLKPEAREPRLDVNQALVSDEYFDSVRLINEGRLRAALKEGKTIPGVTVVPRNQINMTVKKKESAQ